ncbi:MAG: DUF554 domain-containing protein [Clostridia bacterium]|nr:DUF554 domain-containing protein [Clostridia bacterium]
MPFVGTLINFAAILVFSFLGSLVKSGIPERINRAILHAVAVCVIYIGLDGALEPSDAYLDTIFGDTGLTKFVIIIVSLVIGTAIGEAIDIDKWVSKLGAKIEAKLVKGDVPKGDFAKGFVSCTIMTCVGAMAVNGAILDAQGEPSILIAKSVIDAVSCFVMAASLGIGCAFSAFPMLIYQGAITLMALLMSAVMPAASIYYLSVTGSLIIVLIGTNFIGATNVKTANMTPAVFIPLIITPILSMF